MIGFFKTRYKKLRSDTKQYAVKYNVGKMERLAFVHGVLNVMILSSILSVYSVLGLVNLPLPEYGLLYDIIWVGANLLLPVYCIGILFTLGKFFVYPYILLYHYNTKFFVWIFNRIDMYWWRKYRKQSPLTEFMFKSQVKGKMWFDKQSVQRRRLLKLGLVLGIGMIVLSTRWDVIEGLFQ